MTYREFLEGMASLPEVMPGLDDLLEGSGLSPRALAAVLERLIDRGHVEVLDGLGARKLFSLTPLAAERMGLRLSDDSRRWVTREGGRLTGGRRAYYWPKGARVRATGPARVPDGVELLDLIVDPRQPDPVATAILNEEAAARRPYGEHHLPIVRHLLGLRPAWPIPPRPDAKCPACGNAVLKFDAYCAHCDNAGAERFLPPVAKARRRQMPSRTASTLKGGVG